MMPPYHRIVYVSEVALTVGHGEHRADEISHILDVARLRNEASGVTGALLHTQSQFVQVLEGSLPALEATFERICRDTRHTAIRLLDFASVDQPSFSAWSMAEISGDEMSGSLRDRLSGAWVAAQTSDTRTAGPSTVDMMLALLQHGPRTGLAA